MLDYTNAGKSNSQQGNAPGGTHGGNISQSAPPSVLAPNDNKHAPAAGKDPQRMIKHTLSEQTLLGGIPASASLSSRLSSFLFPIFLVLTPLPPLQEMQIPALVTKHWRLCLGIR